MFSSRVFDSSRRKRRCSKPIARHVSLAPVRHAEDLFGRGLIPSRSAVGITSAAAKARRKGQSHSKMSSSCFPFLELYHTLSSEE
jgi:hypothetical protein